LQAAARRRLGAVNDPPGILSQLRAGTPSSRRQEKRQRREQEGQAAGVIGDVAHPGATLAEEGTAQTDENPATANTVAPTAIPHAFVGRSTTAATPHASTEAITASGTAASRKGSWRPPMVAPKCTIDAITSIAALAAIRPAMSVSVGRSWEGVSCPGVVAGDAGWDMRSLSRPRVMASSGGVRGGSRCAQRKGPAHGRPLRSKSLSSRLTRAGKRCKYREVVWSGPRHPRRTLGPPLASPRPATVDWWPGP